MDAASRRVNEETEETKIRAQADAEARSCFVLTTTEELALPGSPPCVCSRLFSEGSVPDRAHTILAGGGVLNMPGYEIGTASEHLIKLVQAQCLMQVDDVTHPGGLQGATQRVAIIVSCGPHPSFRRVRRSLLQMRSAQDFGVHHTSEAERRRR